jgi:hypothetical protein
MMSSVLSASLRSGQPPLPAGRQLAQLAEEDRDPGGDAPVDLGLAGGRCRQQLDEGRLGRRTVRRAAA